MNSIGFPGPRAEHDDRDCRRRLRRANRPADRQSVDTRQHHIQDHEIRRLLAHTGRHILARRDDLGDVPRLFQVHADEVRDIAVVFDDQNPAHARPILIPNPESLIPVSVAVLLHRFYIPATSRKPDGRTVDKCVRHDRSS